MSESEENVHLLKVLTSGQLYASYPLPESDPFTPLLARYLPVQSRPNQRRHGQWTPDETTAALIVRGIILPYHWAAATCFHTHADWCAHVCGSALYCSLTR